jgi:uncharacterized membrane protein
MAADSFEAAFTYPGETKDPETEDLSLEITLRNTGLRGDTFLVDVIEAPEGWTYELTRFSTVLTGIFLPGEENAILNLTVFPPKKEDDSNNSNSNRTNEISHKLPEGQFSFKIKVTSQKTGNSVESSTVLTIAARQTELEELTLSTSYPEIGGPSDGRFSFSLDIRNNGSEEARVNLAAEVPQGWD